MSQVLASSESGNGPASGNRDPTRSAASCWENTTPTAPSSRRVDGLAPISRMRLRHPGAKGVHRNTMIPLNLPQEEAFPVPTARTETQDTGSEAAKSDAQETALSTKTHADFPLGCRRGDPQLLKRQDENGRERRNLATLNRVIVMRPRTQRSAIQGALQRGPRRLLPSLV